MEKFVLVLSILMTMTLIGATTTSTCLHATNSVDTACKWKTLAFIGRKKRDLAKMVRQYEPSIEPPGKPARTSRLNLETDFYYYDY